MQQAGNIMTARPSKIVCVGRSYADHARELGNAVPDTPVLFIKPPSALTALQDGIAWNTALGSCHYECELCLRIDRPLSAETDPQKALQAVGAVTLGLDLTLRDLQDTLKKKGHPWERSKAYDGSCMLADWVSVEDAVSDWNDVHYTLQIDDALRQSGNTSHLIFDIGSLLADISQAFTLDAGDVVMTGTPAGVAALKSGEQLKMTLKGKSQEYVWTTYVK